MAIRPPEVKGVVAADAGNLRSPGTPAAALPGRRRSLLVVAGRRWSLSPSFPAVVGVAGAVLVDDGAAMDLVVLHEQPAVDGAVVVDKPAGMLVHNSAWAGPREHTLTDLVRTRFPEAVPVHRLDRQTSGAIVFAKRSSGAEALQQQLSSSSKPYLALVRGHVTGVLEVDHAITRERGDDDDDKGAQDARSRIVPIACSDVDRCSLVVVVLFTGRKHQARRHCKHVDHPVLGDATHGKGSMNRAYREQHGLARMALHALQVTLDGVVVRAPLPRDLGNTLARLFPGRDLEAATGTVLTPTGPALAPWS